MWTFDWSWENKAVLDLNFSETPEHKCAHLFKVETGNFYAYPNNRIIWYDNAWVFNRIEENPGYEIDLTVYSVENKRKLETSDHYMYEVKDISPSFDDVGVGSTDMNVDFYGGDFKIDLNEPELG